MVTATELELIKPAEAARRYPIGLARLRRLIASGEIPAVVFNPESGTRKRILLRPERVEAWLRAQERPQPAD